MKKLLFIFSAATFLIWPTTVSAQELSSGGGASSLLPGGGLIPECLRKAESVRTTGSECVLQSITHFTNLLLLLVAVGAFLYLLYGAFLYASAFGDEAKIGLAKKTITYAIVGVILAGASAILVALVKSVLQA